MVNVLFVCLGNICRSPSAEGCFRALVAAHGLAHAIDCDSAGIRGWQAGNPPDPRAQATALRRGIDIANLRAREITPEDFNRFDYVLAMDFANTVALYELAPPGFEDRLRLFLEFAPESGEREVVDPYYADLRVFERMFDLIEAGCRGLLQHIRTADLGLAAAANAGHGPADGEVGR